MADSQENHLFNDFIEESLDHLETIEPDLLALEERGEHTPKEIVNRIFRAIHTVKGAAGFFGFSPVSELSHAMESLLTQVRTDEVIPDGLVIDALLSGIDELRHLLNNPKKPREQSVSSLVSQIRKMQQLATWNQPGPVGEQADQNDEEIRPVTVFFENQKFRIILKSDHGSGRIDLEPDIRSRLAGKQLFGLWIFIDEDLGKKKRDIEIFKSEAGKFGQIIGQDFFSSRDEDIVGDDDHDLRRKAVFLYATVMEPDLIAQALDISPDRIMAVDKELLKNPRQPGTEKGKEELKSRDSSESETKPESGTEIDTTEYPLSENGITSRTLRVNLQLLDKLMNLAGELVLGRNQLRQLLGDAVYDNPMMGSVSQNVDRVTTEMQEQIMRMRMQPVGNILGRFKRLIRDLSRKQKKRVKLVISGGDVELDKSILEGLSDPMTHLIRNCVDHGIEPPDDRERAGKPPEGTIDIKALHKAGQVIIIVKDDGRGIDLDKVVKKALAQGVITGEEVEQMTDTEKLKLAFSPGVSTADTISSLSGRGVGMDVVKTNIENYGGSLEMSSVYGKGTTVRIRLPLTLAIIPSLIISTGDWRFAIPQMNISELVCIQVSEAVKRIEKVGKSDVLRLRGNLLPLVRLADVLKIQRRFVHPEFSKVLPDRRERIADRRRENTLPPEKEKEFERRRRKKDRRQRRQGDLFVVVSKVGGNSFGIIVDELSDIEETVVQPLSGQIKDCKCYAGATILGDGKVALILDTAGVAELGKIRFSEVESEYRRRLAVERSQRKDSVEPSRAFLLFRSGRDEQFGLTLSEVSRLERVEPDQIEKIGSQRFYITEKKSIPLVRLDQVLPVSSFPENPEESYVIIPKRFQIGIMATAIMDIFEESMALEKSEAAFSGAAASAIVNQKTTIFPDLEKLMELLRKSCITGSESTLEDTGFTLSPWQ